MYQTLRTSMLFVHTNEYAFNWIGEREEFQTKQNRHIITTLMLLFYMDTLHQTICYSSS